MAADNQRANPGLRDQGSIARRIHDLREQRDANIRAFHRDQECQSC